MTQQIGGIFTSEETRLKENGTTEKEVNIHIRLYKHFQESGMLAKLKGAPLSVLISILLYADSDGEAYPSAYALSENTGYSENTVRKACRKLEEIGWIERDQRRTEGGEWAHTVYTIKHPSDRHTKNGQPSNGQPSNGTEGLSSSEGVTKEKKLACADAVDNSQDKKISKGDKGLSIEQWESKLDRHTTAFPIIVEVLEDISIMGWQECCEVAVEILNKFTHTRSYYGLIDHEIIIFAEEKINTEKITTKQEALARLTAWVEKGFERHKSDPAYEEWTCPECGQEQSAIPERLGGKMRLPCSCGHCVLAFGERS